jgi:hypothetical protein
MLLLLGVCVFVNEGCQSRDLSTAPRLSPRPGPARDVYCSTQIVPTPDCIPDSTNGSGGEFDDGTGQSSFWPSGFGVIFMHGGTEFFGEAAMLGPAGFGSSQAYNYIGSDVWGNTCIGEIDMSVLEAVVLKETGVVTFNDFTMTCY